MNPVTISLIEYLPIRPYVKVRLTAKHSSHPRSANGLWVYKFLDIWKGLTALSPDDGLSLKHPHAGSAEASKVKS